MTFLLDTHAFLWAINEPERLSARAKRLILGEDNELVISSVSIWEIVLKVQAGKLDLPASREYFEAHMAHLGVRRLLSVNPMHVYGLLKLPPVHKDPFDRLLAAQCIAERLKLISSDSVFQDYPVEAVW